jgi:hypothetical protein
MAVRPPGKEWFTRLRRLGDDYTEEALRQRILQNDPAMLYAKESLGHLAQSGQTPLPSVQRGRYRGTWRNAQRKKIKGLQALYLWYAYRMGNVRKGGSSSRKTHYLLREDIRKLQKRDRMATLLVKNRIETYEQLHAHRDECREMISYLCERRAELKNQVPSASVEAKLTDIRAKLKVLRREVRLCNDIEVDSVALQEKRAALKRLEHEKRHGEKQRAPVRYDHQRI